MPQNKPMKIQWITVNGRQVPLVLPQTYSYADDDWKVTSDRDPLPIVEYGTTEGGVIVPKRVSGEGHELTQLTGSIVLLGRAFDRPVSAGSKAYIFNYTVGLHDFKNVIIAVTTASIHDYKVALSFPVADPGGTTSIPIYEVLGDKFEKTQTHSLGTLEPLPILGDTLQIRIFNNDTEDQTYTAHVWGVR